MRKFRFSLFIRRSLGVVGLPLFFASCEGDVRFTTDQPNGIAALKEIPAELFGDYVNGNDSLYVRAHAMTLVRPSVKMIPIADSASVGLSKTKNGKFVFRNSDHYIKSMTKDSVTVVYRNMEVYKLGADTLLKKWNDDYWLNMKVNDVRAKGGVIWKVMQVSLHKQQLAIAVPLLPKDEKVRMQDRMIAAKINVDSSGAFSAVTPFHRLSDADAFFVVNATPDQLKNLDRRGLFRPVATFDKVK